MNEALHAKYLDEVRAIARDNQRVAAHATVELAFTSAVAAAPRLIVEVGTGGCGIPCLRTQALVRAAALFDARHESCDVRDCSKNGNGWYAKWKFTHTDGVSFASVVDGYADVLSIDTDETYPTTKAIWEAWHGKLSPSCTVMFRCSNLAKKLIYEDGSSTMLGWDNQRGVIRVIEELLGTKYDETRPQQFECAGWRVTHVPWGAGMTVLRRG